MTQKLFGLCAICALLFVFATANVASAEETATTGCSCGCAGCLYAANPYVSSNPCCPPFACRIGLFGVVRPVVYAPVYRPVCVPQRFVCPPYIPYRTCPPYYVWH